MAFWALFLFLLVFTVQYVVPQFLELIYRPPYSYLNSILLNFILLGLIVDYFRLGKNIWLLFLPILCYGTYYGYSIYETTVFNNIKSQVYKSNPINIVDYNPDQYEIIMDNIYGPSAHSLLEKYSIPRIYKLYGSGKYEEFQYTRAENCQGRKIAEKYKNGYCATRDENAPEDDKIQIKIKDDFFMPGLNYIRPDWYKKLSKRNQSLITYVTISYEIEGRQPLTETILYPWRLNIFPVTPFVCGNLPKFSLTSYGNNITGTKHDGYGPRKACAGMKNGHNRHQPILFRAPRSKSFDDLIKKDITAHIANMLNLSIRQK